VERWKSNRKETKNLTSAQQYDYCEHAHNASSKQLTTCSLQIILPILVKPISAKLVK
jgi:hypothetical protein